MDLILYDYTELTEDWYYGSYEQSYYIGQGKLSASVVVPQIQAVPEGEEIIVHINSVGGLVFDGWSIYNALKAHKGKVSVRIEGIAASIASVIAMAGETVVICQAAMLMIHKPTIDPFWCGCMDAEDLKREAHALDQIQAVLNSIYKSKTNLDAAVIDSMINTETWITPAEAVTMGFADSLDATITEATVAQNTFMHLFKNADAKTRAYANTFIKINKTMDIKDSLKQVNETSAKTNNLLTDLGNWFKNDFPKLFKNDGEAAPPAATEATNASAQLEDESYIYYTGELAVDTAVFTDEAMTIAVGDGDHTLMDGRTITVAAGKVTVIAPAVTQDAATTDTEEVTNLKAQAAEMQTALTEATNALNKANEMLEGLKGIKSTYTPPAKQVDFSKPKDKPADTVDASPEARAARKEARKAAAKK